MNYTKKVGGALPIITHFRTAFLNGHSSNFTIGASSISLSLSKAEPYDDSVL